MPSLIQPLPDGPIDIVGDVHGEIDALRQLLCHIGYSDDGRHPQGRRLVFVGDLVNRGPDSPAVVEWVAKLVGSSRAKCVLGNHELNLLLDLRRAHNNWFYGEPQHDEAGRLIPQVLAGDDTRRRMRTWFRSLPLALHRPDLRIVHACWDGDMVAAIRSRTDVLRLLAQARAKIDVELSDCDDDLQRELEHRNRNPALKLTEGPLERMKAPVHVGTRVRFTRRWPWWIFYHDPTFCIFGHYSHPEGTFVGSHSTLCIDFGVGKRWMERRMGVQNSFTWKLAALRFPEKELVFDDGRRRMITKP